MSPVSTSSIVSRHWLIRGKVQGVAYRASMVERATFLGVSGWVRNRVDGSVEAMVSGPADAVQSLYLWAKCGPAWAEVEAVEEAVSTEVFSGFHARQTA